MAQEQTIRVLIVEDDSCQRKQLVKVFKMMKIDIGAGKFGFTVETARDGEEALTKLESTSVQLVVSDWDMPIMDGAELLKAIRARTDSIGKTPFILVTGGHADGELDEVIEAGANGVLLKPFPLKRLREAVSEALTDYSPESAPASEKDEIIELDDGTEVPLAVARLTCLGLDDLNGAYGFTAIVNFLAICNGELDRFYENYQDKAEEICLLHGMLKPGTNGKRLQITSDDVRKVANSCMVQKAGSAMKIVPPRSLQLFHKRWQGQNERAQS